MKLKVTEPPREIEKKFNQIKEKINSYILKNHSSPPKYLFGEFDYEFTKAEEKYKQQGNKLNLLHMKHNYLWSKSFQYLEENPTKSLKLVIEALSNLLDRHAIRPYEDRSLKNMLGTYKVPLIKISERSESVNFDEISEYFWEFIQKYFSQVKISEYILDILNSLLTLFVEKNYEKKINKLKISFSNLGESEEIAAKILEVADIIESTSIGKTYLPSLCYESLYKLRRKQLHFIIKSLFFEESNEKKEKIQNLVDKITDEMIFYSKKSLEYAKHYYRQIPEKKRLGKNIQLMISLKELDKMMAIYYREAYAKKDIFKAWKTMDKIKQYLVKKAFSENIPLSEPLLIYFGEEWTLLYMFAKIYLLKGEIRKRREALSEKWEQEIFDKIADSIEDLEKLFKYEAVDKKGYTLKIISAQFSGGFSEYFIHELFLEFFEYGRIDEETPEEFRSLFETIKHSKREDIKLNDVIVQNKPDIDIHIKNQSAIFLKNSKIESDELKQIWKEIGICKKCKTNKIFYGINFIKNISNIEYIHRAFEKIKRKNPEVSIGVFDIKDLVSTLLSELKRCGISKLNFSQIDLYKILDY